MCLAFITSCAPILLLVYRVRAIGISYVDIFFGLQGWAELSKTRMHWTFWWASMAQVRACIDMG